jgi:3-deoxy-D-manno-octulosonic-acid transferase
MPWLLNFLYGLALLLMFPWLLFRAWKSGRYRSGLTDKLLGHRCRLQRPPSDPKPVWFHGVSVGEIHLLRQVVAAFRRRHPCRPCVVSTTTDTGLREARKSFPDLNVILFPFDFSWAVQRTLRQVDPALVVLAESELWPNFLLAARRGGVPVAVINGRMSPRSFGRYRHLGSLARWLFGHLDLLVVQTEAYAASFRALGADPARVKVTGSVKYDGVRTSRDNADTVTLRRLLNVAAEDLVWIAGSTQAPEEDVVLDIYSKARHSHPHLRLFLVPRQPDRFNVVAELVRRSGLAFVRRSTITAPLTERPPVVLMDTIGELGALWGLADVAFVGGSLDGKRGGQNMIEPAAYGAAVLFGPHVWNFRDTAERLVDVEGAIQVADREALEKTILRLLASPAERGLLGTAARLFVLGQQGATEKTVNLLGTLLSHPHLDQQAA